MIKQSVFSDRKRLGNRYPCRINLFLFASVGLFNLVTFSLTPQEIASNAFPSVVVVISQDESGNDFSLGTGFFVAPSIIATNLHVIEGATKVRIRPIGATDEHEVIGFTAVDYDNDLVLLETTMADIQPLKIGDDTATAIGDDIYVIGNPVGLEGTFSKGMISGKREINNHRIIQITAPISSGSSGGPVLSENGEVIGVAVAYIAEGQNLNFAVPSLVVSNTIKNQHETASVALLRRQNIKKISPTDLYSDQISVSLGNVVLYLGMPEEEAKDKLSAYYNVGGFKGNEGDYVISEGKGSVPNIIGYLSCEEGKVASLTRNLGEAQASDDIVDLFKTLTARLQAIENTGTSLCLVESSAQKLDYEIGKGYVYTIKLKFKDYSITLDVHGLNDMYDMSIHETLQ